MKCRWCPTEREFDNYRVLTYHQQMAHPLEYWTGRVRYHEKRAKINQRLAQQAREMLTNIKLYGN